VLVDAAFVADEIRGKAATLRDYRREIHLLDKTHRSLKLGALVGKTRVDRLKRPGPVFVQPRDLLCPDRRGPRRGPSFLPFKVSKLCYPIPPLFLNPGFLGNVTHDCSFHAVYRAIRCATGTI